MAKIPHYYVRSNGLHESIIRLNEKRRAFHGHTDAEVYNKIKAYHAEAATKSAEAFFKDTADTWWAEIEPTLEHTTLLRAANLPISARRSNTQT